MMLERRLQATLPRRHDFKTVYDALQLQRCNGILLPHTPAAEGTIIPPKPKPPIPPAETGGARLFFVDARSTGGDGSEARPFGTLEAAVAASASPAVAPATIVLRGGAIHRTRGVVLTAAHSGLTIQSFEGEGAVVSGAVAVYVHFGAVSDRDRDLMHPLSHTCSSSWH